ncbi:hypothetical protein ACI7BZ_16960 [Xanthobacter sp. AM11]|uniref:hypothetical protein n=1 Tax=Xanthobacter sp. AM11 TaxID=3380643 RepID=UPI0039BF54A2
MSAPEAKPPAPLALKLAIGLGLLANAGLAALLIGISGFVFGGPEGARGEASAVMGWASTLAICLLSPALGLWMWRRNRRDLALAMTWLPPLAFLVGVVAVF